MKQKLFVLALLALVITPLRAETEDGRYIRPHELRLNLGDCLWENLIWRNEPHPMLTDAGSGATLFEQKYKYAYSPHIAAEYHYRVNRWLSAGMMVDFQYTSWTKGIFDNKDQLVSSSRENFYNLSILPGVRFTYVYHPNISLYTTIALGLDINGGSEQDLRGKTTACGLAVDIRALGIAAGKDHWWGTIDVGGLTAMRNKGTIFMVCSRIITAGVAYTF